MADYLAADTVAEQLAADVQRELVHEVREVLRQAPLVRPSTPGGTPMRVRVSNAGAVGFRGDGGYRYDATDHRGRPWPAIPARWREIANSVAGEHPWDCAVINWYDADAMLGWHRDLAERDRSLPIVTISLGDAASWAIQRIEGGQTSRVTLRSGAVTLLAGPTRLYRHTIERIVPEPLLSPLAVRGRVSITLRVAR